MTRPVVYDGIVYDWRGLTRFATGLRVVAIMRWLRSLLPVWLPCPWCRGAGRVSSESGT